MSDHSRPLRDEFVPAPSPGHATLTLARRCFGDEIAIDFPSLGVVVDRVRDHFLVVDDGLAAESAEVVVSRRQAMAGAIVPLALILRGLCQGCGGRGESWSERCDHCAGSGERDMPHHFRFAVPAGIVDGTRFRFVVAPPQTRPTRVDVTVSVA